MSAPTAKMAVAVDGQVVRVKITGRANFTSSVDFKALLTGLRERGHDRFAIDLSDCLIMDSTFLGVLAGLGMRFTQKTNGQAPAKIELVNPSERLAGLIDNLGVASLFTIVHCPPADGVGFQPVAADSVNASKTEVTRTCLEAHETLMSLNPANAAKFKDVTRFLAEDLKRSESADAAKP